MKIWLICLRPPLSLTQKSNWRKHLEAIVVTTRARRNQDWSTRTLLLVQLSGTGSCQCGQS